MRDTVLRIVWNSSVPAPYKAVIAYPVECRGEMEWGRWVRERGGWRVRYVKISERRAV